MRIALVRRGRFRRRTHGAGADIDPTVGYLGLPEEEERFAHPAGGDTCTSISLTPVLWHTLAGDFPEVTTSTLYVDARLDFAHRRLLTAIREPDIDYAGAERVVDLIAGIIRQVVATTTPRGASVSAGDRALVAAARSAIGDGQPAASGLIPLAAHLGASPYRLSRAFSREMGVSLTRYRNRVRVARALDRLEAGESHLAILAADLGFADQAHLCRTVRDHVGHTPTALHRILANQVPSPAVAASSAVLASQMPRTCFSSSPAPTACPADDAACVGAVHDGGVRDLIASGGSWPRAVRRAAVSGFGSFRRHAAATRVGGASGWMRRKARPFRRMRRMLAGARETPRPAFTRAHTVCHSTACWMTWGVKPAACPPRRASSLLL